MVLKYSLVFFYFIISLEVSKACYCPKREYKPYIERKKYLVRFHDSKKLKNLALIGTYSSLSYKADLEKSRTQDLTIEQQLKYGVRFFDITVRLYPSNIVEVYLDEATPSFSLADALVDIDRFLDENPGELVIVHLSEAYLSFFDDTKCNCKILNAYARKSTIGQRFVQNWRLDDTIGQHRGKILLASMDSSFYGCVFDMRSECSINYDFVNKYEAPIEDMEKKWNNVRDHIDKSFSGIEECYINNICHTDGRNSRRSIARDADYGYKRTCATPLNDLMRKYFRNPHRGLVVVLADYMTQELSDAVNDTNFPNSTWRIGWV